MIIIPVKFNNIDKAIKMMRRKLRQTKQHIKLREGRYYTKKSEMRRLEKQKAQYVQKLKDNEE